MPTLIVALLIIIFFISGGIHKVDEGHIGLYWRGGSLLDSVTEPGYHFLFPLWTTFANIQVTLQTDRVEKIPVF